MLKPLKEQDHDEPAMKDLPWKDYHPKADPSSKI